MTRKYLENLESDAGDVVPGGTYTLEVVDARALETKPFVWIDFRVIGGPDADRVTSCGLNLPDDSSSRGAIFHFKKKIRGFLPQLSAANVLSLPDDDQPDAIAEAILGAVVEADLSIQVGGDYDGSQQLEETRQVVDPMALAAVAQATASNGAPEPIPTEPASVPAAVAAPAAPTPSAPAAGGPGPATPPPVVDEAEALRQRLAELESSAPAASATAVAEPVAAPVAAEPAVTDAPVAPTPPPSPPAASDEVPF
jgi:hypothetical protein